MDGMEGLAIAILGASLCLLVVPALVLAGLGYFALRNVGGNKGGALGAAAGLVIGLLVGGLVVTYTFFESTWNPPLEITFEMPAGYPHETVIMLEDPAATADIPWTGLDAPLSTRSATIPIPRSGVLRVRSVTDLMTHDRAAHLSDGRVMMGMIMRPAPPGLSASQLVVFDFAAYGTAREPDMSMMTDEVLTRTILAREAER
jgi:hypothetical protein